MDDAGLLRVLCGIRSNCTTVVSRVVPIRFSPYSPAKCCCSCSRFSAEDERRRPAHLCVKNVLPSPRCLCSHAFAQIFSLIFSQIAKCLNHQLRMLQNIFGLRVCTLAHVTESECWAVADSPQQL